MSFHSSSSLPILATEQDKRRLTAIVTFYLEKELVGSARLATELDQAEVVPGARVPATVVTMNPRVLCRDDDGLMRELTLVYPTSADFELGRVSVLEPLGIALLGARLGDLVTPGDPKGRTFRIERIRYQPEAACDFDL